MTTQTAGRQPNGQPKHRDTAAKHLSEASDYLNKGALELAQTYALLAIGHALVDIAMDGIEVFQQTPTRQRAEAQASDQLTQALVRAAARGQRPRCADGEVASMFLAEDPRHRAIAATYCNGCVVWSECDEVGTYQTFGVYGGRDVTRTPRKRRNLSIPVRSSNKASKASGKI